MFQNLTAHIYTNFANLFDGVLDAYVPTEDLENEVSAWSWRVVAISAIIVVVLVLISWAVGDKYKHLKLPLFVGLAGTMVFSTLFLIGSTVFLNVKSDSGGPVHWHADFEMWACGNELELRDPTGFSNKIGTSTLHEHDDRRIHLEGVVVDDLVDASLGKFMHVIGGAITNNAMIVPLNPERDLLFENEFDGDGPAAPNPELLEEFYVDDGLNGLYAKFLDGQSCGDQVATPQVFLYEFNESDDTYVQRKLENPRDYVITDNPNVPPGDCVIFEFDVAKEKTDKICEQYGVRDVDRCEEFGVEPNERRICTITQLNYDPDADYRENNLQTGPEVNADDLNITPDLVDGVLDVLEFDPREDNNTGDVEEFMLNSDSVSESEEVNQ